MFALVCSAANTIAEPSYSYTYEPIYANEFSRGTLTGLQSVESHPELSEISASSGWLLIRNNPPADSPLQEPISAAVTLDFQAATAHLKPSLAELPRNFVWSFRIDPYGTSAGPFRIFLACDSADPMRGTVSGYVLESGTASQGRLILRRLMSDGSSSVLIDTSRSHWDEIQLKDTALITVRYDADTREWSLNVHLKMSWGARIYDIAGIREEAPASFSGFRYFAIGQIGAGGFWIDDVKITANLRRNEAPIAAPDVVTYPGTRGIEFYPLANDSDPENDKLTIVSVSPAVNGQVTFEQERWDRPARMTYIPAQPDATEKLTYTISDRIGVTATTTITLRPASEVPQSSTPGVRNLFLKRDEQVVLNFGSGNERLLAMEIPEKGTLQRILPHENQTSDPGVKYRATSDGAVGEEIRYTVLKESGEPRFGIVRIHAPPTGYFEGVYRYSHDPSRIEGRLRVQMAVNRTCTYVAEFRGRIWRGKSEFGPFGDGGVGYLRIDENGKPFVTDWWDDTDNDNGGNNGGSWSGGVVITAGSADSEIRARQSLGSNTDPIGWRVTAYRVDKSFDPNLQGRYTITLPPNPEGTRAIGYERIPDDRVVVVIGPLGVPMPVSLGTGYTDRKVPPGWMTARITSEGSVRLAGMSGQGTQISASGRLLSDGSTLLYAPLRTSDRKKKPGSLGGSLRFRESGESVTCEASLSRLKPYKTKGYERLVFPQKAVGELYTPPGSHEPPINLSSLAGNCRARIAAPDFAQPLLLESFLLRDKLEGPMRIRMNISRESGVFRGTFRHPDTQHDLAFSGVFLQSRNKGIGGVLSTVYPVNVTIGPIAATSDQETETPVAEE